MRNVHRYIVILCPHEDRFIIQKNKMLHMRLKLSTIHLQHCIMQPPSTTLTITLTRHALIATLLEYIALERSTALKRKMFGMLDGRELGHLSQQPNNVT